MCGIVGFNWQDEKLLRQMMAMVEHRGPDESGCYLDEGVSLGHQRLKVIDLLTGKQPIHNEDGSVQIVFDGGIYNYLELKEGLLEKGHRFYTNSDTEVIVHAYEQYDTGCVKQLEGMFAFAVWDINEKRLFLARDRLGIKPLYYYIKGNKFIFASELKAILEYDGVRRNIDLNALNEFFSYRYVPSERTLIDNIYKLLPGHILILKDGKIQISKYWDLVENIADEPEEYYIEKLRELLRKSVKQRLMSDVPLGVYLSGGLDSTCVVALMSELTAHIKTFSVGFGSEGEDELEYATFVSHYFGTDHYELGVGEKDLNLLPEMVWHMDEPIGDAATLPTYVLSRFAKKEVTVVLAGEGGDELFAGYDNYKIMMLGHNFSKLLPGFLNHRLFPIIGNYFPESSNVKRALNLLAARSEVEQYLSVISLFNENELRKLGNFSLDSNLNNYFPDDTRLLNKLLYFGIKTWLPNDFFIKADKMTMAHAVEERVPILDHNIVEFAFTIPTRLKLKGLTGKYIFKKAMAGLLPDQIIKRRKHGLDAPADYWFRHSLKGVLEQLLHESKHNYYNKEYVLDLLTRFQKSRGSYNMNFLNAQKLWSILIFEIWYRIFIENKKPETF
ncbi:Asparagine synthetase [glutamine-hydrolyzing] 1 [subsurface metagenome]